MALTKDFNVNTLVLTDANVKAAGNSGNITIGAANHVDVLIKVGTETGTAAIQFHVQVIESTSGSVIRTYDGTSLSATGVDYIGINNVLLGDTIRITWDGTLSDSHWFAGVYCRVLVR